MAEVHGIAELYEAFGHVPPPKTIPHHREGCCGSDDYYARLVRKHRSSLDASDFGMYLPHVLLPGNGTAEDFSYFLPRLLELWVLYLPEGTVVDDWLFTKLLEDGFIHRRLAPELREAIIRFVDRTFLSLVDDVRAIDEPRNTSPVTARPAWPAIWYTRGQLGPIAHLWSDWWGFRTLGRARAAAQFASCLVTLDESNPLFLPWTRDGGGGPPSLLEDLSIGFSPGWLPENVEEFKRRLTPESLADLVRRCEEALPAPAERSMVGLLASRLQTLPEIAQAKLYDLEDSISAPLPWMNMGGGRP